MTIPRIPDAMMLCMPLFIPCARSTVIGALARQELVERGRSKSKERKSRCKLAISKAREGSEPAVSGDAAVESTVLKESLILPRALACSPVRWTKQMIQRESCAQSISTLCVLGCLSGAIVAV